MRWQLADALALIRPTVRGWFMVDALALIHPTIRWGFCVQPVIRIASGSEVRRAHSD
jgi:hypothetical protein